MIQPKHIPLIVVSILLIFAMFSIINKAILEDKPTAKISQKSAEEKIISILVVDKYITEYNTPTFWIECIVNRSNKRLYIVTSTDFIEMEKNCIYDVEFDKNILSERYFSSYTGIRRVR